MDSDNKKITQLTQVTSLNDSDLFVVIIDPGTSPLTRGVQKQNINQAGTYTPTLYNSTNVAASSVAQDFLYFRISNMVIISGAVSLDPTTAGALTELGVSIPVASNFATAYDAHGNVSSPGENVGSIISDSANNRLLFYSVPTGAGAVTWRIMAMYTII